MPLDPVRVRALLHPDADGQVSLADFLDVVAQLARESGDDLDWIAAGGLVRGCWEALAAETEMALARLGSTPAATPTPAEGDPWGDLLRHPFAVGLDSSRAYTSAVVAGADDPIRPATRRRTLGRRATIDELLAALEDARREAEARAPREAAAARRARREARARASVASEDPAADIARLRAALPPFGELAALFDLSRGRTPAERVAVLMAALEMRRSGEIVLEQETFPISPVRVRRGEGLS